MDKFCVLFNFILIITTFGSIMSANSIGFLYDDQRQKLDRNYKGNHSFRYNKNWKHKFAFSFPFPIVNKVFENELKAITQKYNRAAYIFLVSSSILILEIFINYLNK